MTRPKEELNPAAISRALGLFLVVFAAVVLVASAFTDTRSGAITNLAAGLVLMAIGAGMIRSGRAA